MNLWHQFAITNEIPTDAFPSIRLFANINCVRKSLTSVFESKVHQHTILQLFDRLSIIVTEQCDQIFFYIGIAEHLMFALQQLFYVENTILFSIIVLLSPLTFLSLAFLLLKSSLWYHSHNNWTFRRTQFGYTVSRKTAIFNPKCWHNYNDLIACPLLPHQGHHFCVHFICNNLGKIIAHYVATPFHQLD